jgi:UDP-N-acetyl-D-galactosamine dehydrogenase
MKKIAVIGLGYVGLPLAVEFGRTRKVVGFDINSERVEELKKGYDRTLEVEENDLKSAKFLEYSSEEKSLSDSQIYIITVPTPIDSKNQPDLTPVKKSTETVAKYLKKGDIVIYESTVYPGVTEEVCVPIIEEVSGLKFNEEFFCGYSPERINPGDKVRTLTKILKITSGSTPEIATEVDELYKSIITAGTHKAESLKVAEAAKVIENTQRDVNIAIINELAMIFDHMNIDTNAVLEAAGTKWNFIPLKPGLVGGHCIGVDPYYLTFKAEELGYRPNLILQSRQINNGMGKFIAEKTIKFMIQKERKVKNADILIMGLTFKENTPDLRNTRVVDIIDELKTYECHVDVYDPWVDKNEEKKTYNHGLIENPFENNKKYDAIIVAVAHNQFLELKREEFSKLFKGEEILIDVKGIIENPTWKL